MSNRLKQNINHDHVKRGTLASQVGHGWCPTPAQQKALYGQHGPSAAGSGAKSGKSGKTG